MVAAIDQSSLISDILKSTDYALEVFEESEIEQIEIFEQRKKPYLRDWVDGKERLATKACCRLFQTGLPLQKVLLSLLKLKSFRFG